MWTTIAVILICCAVGSLTFVVFRIIAWLGALQHRVDEVWDIIYKPDDIYGDPASSRDRWEKAPRGWAGRDRRSSAGRD